MLLDNMPKGYTRMKEKISESYIDEVLQNISSDILEAQIPSQEICMVDYLKKVLEVLQKESCGKCTLCRLSLRQLSAINRDAVGGQGRSDDMDMMKLLCEGLRSGTDCIFGKKTANFIEKIIDDNVLEFEDHIVKKTCKAMVCEEYTTIHILGDLCQGCEECIEVCQDGAITGKKGYIHMIDNQDCTKCGKCIEICPEEAIVVAGGEKPRCPEKLTRVGRFRTRRKSK